MKKSKIFGTLLFSLLLSSCTINTNEVISFIQNIDVTDGSHSEQASNQEVITDLHYHIYTLAKQTGYSGTYEQFIATVNSEPTSDYCNFNLLTSNGEVILVYGLATADGSQKYGTKRQISELPIKQGDVVLLQANLCNYNSYGTSKPELLNARLISVLN